MELELHIRLNDKFDFEDQLRGPMQQLDYHKQAIEDLNVGGTWTLFSGEDNIVGWVVKLA